MRNVSRCLGFVQLCVCVFGKYQLANIMSLVDGGFIALSQILRAMSLLSANFWSYVAAGDVQLICIDINYELISCSGLVAYFSFVM